MASGAWVCWMTKTMARVRAATSVWKTVSHRAGNPVAMLMPTQERAAASTNSTVTGRQACRSTRDSHRLTGDLDGSPGGPGSATEPNSHWLPLACDCLLVAIAIASRSPSPGRPLYPATIVANGAPGFAGRYCCRSATTAKWSEGQTPRTVSLPASRTDSTRPRPCQGRPTRM